MAKEEMATGMRDVDRTTDPGFFVHYLDTASAQEPIQAFKRRTFELLEVKPGAQLLDIGCGTGDDGRTLAQMVGSTGRVVGVDHSETMIAEARKRAEGSNLPVEYQVGEAQHMDFANDTFDGCRAERVFMHVENPRQTLAEMIRITRPGGRIVVLDPDFETLIIDAANRSLTRKILNFCCDRIVRNGWIGRQRPRLFREAQLTDISIFADSWIQTNYTVFMQSLRFREFTDRAQEAGVVSATEAASWLEELEQASQEGRFFAAMTFFFVSGRKP
ncbi:MAG TPA: methyltransferase domain-containing protein [Candidatus Binatia bacterium]|jgi:ubiquinone/menaquinone biosynthesis C-methylase UbiE|nr:methyltransferase domain-containing protein [Candidatus Binatia bacterium]